jgi:hypothetical protein
MRAYIGGAKDPLMLSSGLEDYFLGTYYFNRGRYATPVAGLTQSGPNSKRTTVTGTPASAGGLQA